MTKFFLSPIRGDSVMIARKSCIRGFIAAAIAMIVAVASAQTSSNTAVWPCLGGGPDRADTRATVVGSFASPRWTLRTPASGEPISFVGPAGVVAAYIPIKPLSPRDAEPKQNLPLTSQQTAILAPRLFATATIAGESRALSIDARNGQIVW